MKKYLATTIVGLFLVVSLTVSMPVALSDEGCSCSAPDGSCSVSIGCPDGCYAICSSGGSCSAGCRPALEQQAPVDSISLQANNSNADQLSSDLTRISGRAIVFTPSNPNAAFSFDFRNIKIWDALDVLTRSGRVQIDGQDFRTLQNIRRAFLAGERVNVCFRNMPVEGLTKMLSFVSGLPLRVTSADAQTQVNVTLEEATLREIIAAVSAQTGAQIAMNR